MLNILTLYINYNFNACIHISFPSIHHPQFYYHHHNISKLCIEIKHNKIANKIYVETAIETCKLIIILCYKFTIIYIYIY